jgi:hypothetical protein
MDAHFQKFSCGADVADGNSIFNLFLSDKKFADMDSGRDTVPSSDMEFSEIRNKISKTDNPAAHYDTGAGFCGKHQLYAACSYVSRTDPGIISL